MPKRKFIGNPIDATMSYITERNEGQTVGGTTEDDKGEERTQAIPSFIDESELSPWEKKILEGKILHPDWSLRDLTDELGTNYSKTSGFLSEFRQEHREELEEAGMFETLLFPNSPKSGTYDRPSDDREADQEHERERVFEYLQDNPDASVDDVKKDLDVSNLTPSMIGGIKGNIKKHSHPEVEDEAEEDTTTNRREQTTVISTRTDAEYAEEIEEYSDEHGISQSEALEQAVKSLSRDRTLEKALQNAENDDELVTQARDAHMAVSDMNDDGLSQSMFEREIRNLLLESEDRIRKIIYLRRAELTQQKTEEWLNATSER